ncbi:MAG: response regulator transcription factor, partial [Gemmatimonadaceae bacterium]
ESLSRAWWPPGGGGGAMGSRLTFAASSCSSCGTGAPTAGASRASRAAAGRTVRTAAGRYLVRCCLVAPGEDATDAAPATLAVTLERQGSAVRESLARAVAALGARYGLTEREADVTQLLSAGRSTADIAQALGISPFTARRHTERVIDKLGVRSRADVPRLVFDRRSGEWRVEALLEG